LRQQPKCMCKPLVVRRSLESMFGGIGARCGDPLDIGSPRDEANDAFPLLRPWKRAEAFVTHRLPLRCADQRQLSNGLEQDRIDKCAPSVPASAGGRDGSAVRSRASDTQPSRRRVMLPHSFRSHSVALNVGRGSNYGQWRGRWRIPFDQNGAPPNPSEATGANTSARSINVS
jgi:hypothetical protein